MTESICVLFAASEVSPLASTGGLAEVAGSLPQALTMGGFPSSVVMPAYRGILDKAPFTNTGLKLSVLMADEEIAFEVFEGRLSHDVPIYLIKCDPFFDRPGIYGEGRTDYPDNPERFAFFSRAVIELAERLPKKPDVIVANDWQTGLIMPLLLESGPVAPKGLFIIHNQGYLGLAPSTAASYIGLPDRFYGLEGLEYYGQLSYLKAGIVFSQAVITVSPTYAKEIQTPEYGGGLDGVLRLYSGKLHGIINGVDYDLWSPSTDPNIASNYDSQNLAGKKICKQALRQEVGLTGSDDKPLFGMVSRLTAQKGFTLIVESAADLFKLGLELVILGSGEPWFEEQLTALSELYPNNMRLVIGYDAKFSRRIISGSDFVLVPSLYEPCGLIQLFGLRYGAVPVVRACGGLNDTVRDYAGQHPTGLWDNGFKFSQFQSGALVRAVRRACELYVAPGEWAKMSSSNMLEDFSWAASAKAYAKLIRQVLGAA
ncbi:MAG: glycogen synthase GlgA [Deltaproteobacteria bacterium]|jgi:starch synthase|nr:glycogen synthase GlgA [Deltaproteobacteria bacterium]